MISNANIPIKSSIGFNLLRGVFSIYIIVAIVVTVIHMLIEYFNVKKMIQEDLALYQTTYENQLADALWDLDEERIFTISEGIIKLPAVTALSILDTSGDIIVLRSKHETKSLIKHKFAIKYLRENESSVVGYAIFYSDRETVFTKLSTGFTLIIINSVIKTFALWGIFLWLVKPMLIRPLEELTDRVRNVTIEELDNITPIKVPRVKNEIYMLSQSFNDMKQRLKLSLLSVQTTSTALNTSNNYLEQLIKSAQKMMQAENKKLLLECYMQYLFHGIENLSHCRVRFIYSSYLSAEEKLYFSLDYQVTYNHDTADVPTEITLSNEEIFTKQPIEYQEIERSLSLKSAIANKKIIVPYIWKNKLLAIMTVKLESNIAFSSTCLSYLTTLNQLLTLNMKQIDIKQQLENKVQVRTAELEKSHQEIALKAQELEKTSRYKTKFLANMSHEIRTPMNGVLGSLQLLQQSLLNKESMELVNTALSSSKCLLTIINDILDVTKIEAGKLTLELANFNCQTLIENIINEMHPQTQEQHSELTLQVSDDFTSLWFGDAIRVKQILLNIISNAVKFTKNGQVIIKLSSSSNGLSICVIDTGIGMSEQALKSIFHRFEQADSSTTRQYGGTGLGTNIALSLAKLMKGDITAESQLNKGSKFIITLPLAPENKSVKAYEENTKYRPQHEQVKTPHLSGVSILLAEDNAINRLIFNKLMTPTAVEIIIATNGKECIELFKQRQPDIIFMDIQMPVMDGITACKLIKKEADIPIIALTANVMKEDVLMYEEAGFNGVLSKPIELGKLYQICSDLSEKNKAMLRKNSKAKLI